MLKAVPDEFTPAGSNPEIVYFADSERSFYEKMQLIDSMEILVTPVNDEDKKVEFKWEVMGYNKDYIWLNITFVNPWELSDDMQYDVLSVTFWGTEYFKST